LHRQAKGLGAIRIDIDRRVAARFVSRRLLLPLVMLAVLGAGTALALSGWVWSGLAIIAASRPRSGSRTSPPSPSPA